MMTLNDVFKNTNYDDTLFSEEAMRVVESTIFVKNIKGVEVSYVRCLIRDKEIRLTPEEAVRQLYLFKLMNDYNYPASRIQLETAIHFGREVKRADITIMDKDRPMVPYIIVELKKPKLTDGKEQLKSYCNATGAPIGVWTNGEQIFCYNRKDPNFFEDITDIPKAGQKLSDIIGERRDYQWLTENDIISTQKKSLREKIREMEDEVLASAGVDSFEEIFKLIFAKLYDEHTCANDGNEYLKFRNYGDTDFELKETIQELFDKAKREWDGVFQKESKLQLTPSHLAICVSSLQDAKLFNNNLDVVDDAFEYLMNKSSKGEKGQYFTPRYVIDMCVKMLNPSIQDKIIDPACGSSGFTVHNIFHVWNKYREDNNLPRSDGFATIKRSATETNFVRDNVFGIDFDEKTVRVARTLNLIAGDGQTNVLHLNTLDYSRWDEVAKQDDWNNTYNKGFSRLKDVRSEKIKKNDTQKYKDYSQFEFDIVMANPPFAGDIKEQTILSHYELAKNDKGKWQKAVGRDVLFIERNLNFLKPGGRMAIVLPQGRFNNSSDKYIREFIAERCRILAVVGLHGNVFKPHTGTKTSVLFVQKWDEDKKDQKTGEVIKALCPKREDYPIFFATMQKPSKDNSGDKIYVKDKNGEIVLDSHRHFIVDHDLYNHDGMTEDGIAEAFIEFAKKEGLSFFR
jgi:type I restriction enzyme M protein